LRLARDEPDIATGAGYRLVLGHLAFYSEALGSAVLAKTDNSTRSSRQFENHSMGPDFTGKARFSIQSASRRPVQGAD